MRSKFRVPSSFHKLDLSLYRDSDPLFLPFRPFLEDPSFDLLLQLLHEEVKNFRQFCADFSDDDYQ